MTCVSLFLFSTSAAALWALSNAHHLGEPGVVTEPTEDPKRFKIPLPTEVLNYHAVPYEPSEVELTALPDDTSFGKIRYENGEEEIIDMGVVLMGTDRTSIHKPQFCLNGQGWTFQKTEKVSIPISEPVPYEIPAMKITMTKDMKNKAGEIATLSGTFIYWFVSEDHITSEHWDRMMLMAKGLLTEGVLQRWAYVYSIGICFQGNEERTYDRMKSVLAHAVPRFQVTHGEEAVRAH